MIEKELYPEIVHLDFFVSDNTVINIRFIIRPISCLIVSETWRSLYNNLTRYFYFFYSIRESIELDKKSKRGFFVWSNKGGGVVSSSKTRFSIINW